MSDRLKELQHQRALAEEQLAWLDREIARESGSKPVVPPAGAPADDSAEAKAAAAEREAKKILERFNQVEHPVRDEVKRGCFLYFIAAFGLLILALMGFYFFRRS